VGAFIQFQALPSVPLAVVEIEGTTALVVLAVFLVSFVLVCLVAYWLVASAKRGTDGTRSWNIDIAGRLPVSKATFERVADLTEAAVSRPELTPEKEAFLADLAESRKTALGAYRLGLIAVGLLGVIVAILWFRDASSANMLGLPAAIVMLLSLGAILEGLLPRGAKHIEPIDPRLLDKIEVQVSKEPMTVRLDSTDIRKAADILRQGGSPDEAARAVYPEYDALCAFERTAVREAIADAVRQTSG
jgi:hypothetical protein